MTRPARVAVLAGVLLLTTAAAYRAYLERAIARDVNQAALRGTPPSPAMAMVLGEQGFARDALGFYHPPRVLR